MPLYLKYAKEKSRWLLELKTCYYIMVDCILKTDIHISKCEVLIIDWYWKKIWNIFFVIRYLKIYNMQNEKWIRLQHWTNFAYKNQNWKSLLKLCRVTKFSYHIPTAVPNVQCLCGIKIQLAMNKISPNAKFTRWLLWFIQIDEIRIFEFI